MKDEEEKLILNFSPEVEQDLENLIKRNLLNFALFERKWRREQRAKKKQEQTP